MREKKDWKNIYINGNVVISGWLVKIISLISNRTSAESSLSKKKIKIKEACRLISLFVPYIEVIVSGTTADLKLPLGTSHFPSFFPSIQKARICFLFYFLPSEAPSILIICLISPRRKEPPSVAAANPQRRILRSPGSGLQRSAPCKPHRLSRITVQPGQLVPKGRNAARDKLPVLDSVFSSAFCDSFRNNF